jgi:ubiquinone/menaquinone biosynthesis C-methylase UbiE
MTEIMKPESARILRDHRASSLARIVGHLFPDVRNILVVGCGDGMEAAVLSYNLEASVTGIDVETNFNPNATGYATLQYGDATALEFADESFDLIYSFHALEHIPDPLKALSEMQRVLRNGGGYVIGTPNRHRLVGYVGSDVSLATKIRWNLKDWWMRLMFRFRNEYGAHAGYSSGELSRHLLNAFGNVVDLNYAYYSTVYPSHKQAIDVLFRSGLDHVMLPSVYFGGVKGERVSELEAALQERARSLAGGDL